jgi:hypothetical protein
LLAGVWSVGIVDSLPLEVPPLAPLLLSVVLLPDDAGTSLGLELWLLAWSCRHLVFSSPVSESQLDDGVELAPLSVALCAKAPKESTADATAAAINCNFMNISLK